MPVRLLAENKILVSTWLKTRHLALKLVRNMKNKVLLAVLLTTTLAVVGSLFSGSLSRVAASHRVFTYEECIAQGEKIRICHSTSSETNPYELLNISCSALYGRNDNAGHFEADGSPLAGHLDDYFVHQGDTTCGFVSPEPSTSPNPSTSPTPTIEPSPSEEPQPSTTPDPSSTPDPSASPQPSTTPVPSGEPSPSSDPSPRATFEPSASPTTNSNNIDPSSEGVGGASQGVRGRMSSLATDRCDCDGDETFDAVMDIKGEDGLPVKGVVVQFVYKDQIQNVWTFEGGRAKATFKQDGNGTAIASSEGYPSQSISVTFPPACAESAPKSETKLTTLANTGAVDEVLASGLMILGVVGSIGTTYVYQKKPKA